MACPYIRHGPLIVYSNILLLYTSILPKINNLVEAHCYGIGRTGQIFEQSRSIFSIVLTKTFAVETSTFLSVSSLLRDCSKICPVHYQRCRTIAPKEVPPPFLCCPTNGTGGNQCNVYCCEYSIRLNLPLSCRGSPCLSFPGIRQQQLHHRSKHRSSRCEPHAQYTHAPPMSQAALFAHCMYVLYDTHYTSTQDLQYVCYRMCGYIYTCSAKPHVLQHLLTSLNKCH